MPSPSNELEELIKEAKELSKYIAELKHKKNRVTDQAEIERLAEEIKMRQYKALFYVDKMENLNKEIESER